MPPPELWTVKETANYCRVSVFTIRRWVKDPEHPLRAVTIGQRHLFVPDEVRQLADDQRTAAS
jgi:excisionase family DNA binding protein